uniref:Uncharacterized protein n=1 Tax=Timema douglasi TaxID=61478 RepID=A0A7R8V9C9_TIMDO|nr:unnamed protein product [Timema douglasi]
MRPHPNAPEKREAPRELSDTNIFIPSLSESDTYFAPISPAASTTSLSLPQSSCLKSNGNFKVNPSLLLEMLHRGSDISELSASAINPSIKDLEAAGKVHSVEELEAKIRKSSHTGNHTPADKRNEEDMVAFKKLQQQQQEMLNKLVTGSPVGQGLVSGLNGQFQVPPPPGPPPSLSPLPPELQLMVNNAQPSRELLQRPEALAIIQGLRHGQITSQHIVQQLQNPAMQHRHREVLVNILKFQMRLQRTAVVTGLSPQPLSPHHNVQPPSDLHHIMLQQQQQTQAPQQQLRIPSPLNGGHSTADDLLDAFTPAVVQSIGGIKNVEFTSGMLLVARLSSYKRREAIEEMKKESEHVYGSKTTLEAVNKLEAKKRKQNFSNRLKRGFSTSN